MKNLTFALACASTFALFAEIKAPPAGFEEYEAGAKVANAVEPGSQFTYWLYEGASGSEDGSTVKAYGGDNLAAPTTGDAAGDKYLELSTEGGTLWRSLAEVKQMENGSATLGDAHTIDPEKGLYIDTMVQFTPTEDGGAPDTTGDDKLAIWLNVDSSGVTNLCVKARQVSGTECDGTVDPLGTIYKITNVVPQPGTWYRLTVKAVSDLTSYGGFGGFQIFLDNTVLVADKMTVDGDAYETLSGNVEACSEEKLALITGKKVFASLVALTGLQAVGFKGSGALDNLAITAQDPLPAPGEMIDFTITAGADTTIAWSTDGKTWTDYVAGAQAPAGHFYVRLTNADGATKIITTTLGSDSNSFDVSAETFGWAEYLGEAIDGAYVIDDVAELVMFQKGVATLGSAGVTFKLGADIALTDAWIGIGVAKAKDMVSWALDGKNAITREEADARVAAFTADKGGAFQGVFDGGSHTVSNVKFVRGDYVGFFQSCYRSTIKNLKIELAGDGWEASDVTAFGGGGIAGVVVDTTIENCEASGTFTGSKGVGGIVGYAGSGAVLKGCVNKAAVTSTGNEKVGGLIACAQNGNPDMGANGVVVDGCQNLGNLDCQLTGKEMVGGLVSYTDCVVTFKGANVVNCTLTQTGDKGVQSVVFLNGGSAIVETGATFTVPAAYKTVNKNAVDGLFYATVADGVATLVKNEAAVTGANLKVMANGAPEVVLANIGDAITLDTTLATVTVTTTAENAEVKQEGNVYTVVAKSAAEDWPEDPSTMTGQTAGDAYGITGVLADADAGKLATWAKDKDKGNVAFGAVGTILPEAYLLNVANTEAAIAEGKANFKIPAITIDANGTVTVTDPEGSYNGKITIKGSVTVNGTYDLEKTDTTARFFKAFLSVK